MPTTTREMIKHPPQPEASRHTTDSLQSGYDSSLMNDNRSFLKQGGTVPTAVMEEPNNFDIRVVLEGIDKIGVAARLNPEMMAAGYLNYVNRVNPEDREIVVNELAQRILAHDIPNTLLGSIESGNASLHMAARLSAEVFFQLPR